MTAARDAFTPDLFGAPTLPEGFRYTPEVLSIAEEADLVGRLEALALTPFAFHGFHGFLGKRRIRAFGHRYLFAGQTPNDAMKRIPDWARPLQAIASAISGRAPEAFEQIMVTEYGPGAGIGWHRDGPTFEEIVSISFLAPCDLKLRRRVGEGWERQSVPIAPRSAYLLQGPVRNRWQHSILPMQTLRYSVTLRIFRPGHTADG